MADARRVKLEGVAELKAALDVLGNEVATKVGQKADRAAALEFAEILRATAPYDPREKVKYRRRKDGSVARNDFGHLRDNIRVRKARSRKEFMLTYIVTTGDAFWGLFQEFGTVKMAAKPWMRPAFNATAPHLLNVQIDALRSGINAAAKRAARLKAKGK